MRISSLKSKWKTLTAMSLIALATFAVSSYANRVVVQQVQPIGGNHVQVPAPELQVLDTIWNVNVNQSLVTGLILNVTTIGGPGLTGSRLYSINIQVSCIRNPDITPTPPVRPNCAVGQVSVKLPVNLNGVATLVPVSIAPSLDPEKTEIEDLSFIVTAGRDAALNIYPWNSAVLPLCDKDFVMVKYPEHVTLGAAGSASTSADVNVFLASLCKYSGEVTITASTPIGLTATFSTNPTFVPKGMTVTTTETITSDGTLVPGSYPVTNIATDLFGNIHAWPITVEVM